MTFLVIVKKKPRQTEQVEDFGYHHAFFLFPNKKSPKNNQSARNENLEPKTNKKMEIINKNIYYQRLFSSKRNEMNTLDRKGTKGWKQIEMK